MSNSKQQWEEQEGPKKSEQRYEEWTDYQQLQYEQGQREKLLKQQEDDEWHPDNSDHKIK